jgi:hypothetical protein
MSYEEHPRPDNSGKTTVWIVVAVVGGVVLVTALICGGIGFFFFRVFEVAEQAAGDAMQMVNEQMREELRRQESKQKSERVIRSFLQDIEDNQLDAAYGVTTEAFQKRLTRPAFEELLKKHPLKSLRDEDPFRADPTETQQPGTDEVRQTFSRVTKDGRAVAIRIWAVQEKGENWKIDRFLIDEKK